MQTTGTAGGYVFFVKQVACSCEKCVFDNPTSGVQNKAIADSFEEKMFHIIRAFHVAARCTDCSECSRVCPQKIPLHLLNRKFIHDIDRFYGEARRELEMLTVPQARWQPLWQYACSLLGRDR